MRGERERKSERGREKRGQKTKRAKIVHSQNGWELCRKEKLGKGDRTQGLERFRAGLGDEEC